MRFERKLAAALALLASTGIWRSNYAPPLLRGLWRLGIEVPPPHFRGFAANFVTAGSYFGAAWGSLMWFALWSHQGMSPGSAIRFALVAGSFFGLSMAVYYRHGARKHGIPLWRDFRPIDESVFD